MTFQKISFAKADDFFHSIYFIILSSVVAFLGFFFHLENIAMAVLVMLIGAVFVFSDDLLPSLGVFFLVCWTPLGKYGEGLKFFMPIIYSMIPTLPALIFHFINYAPRRVKGRFFLSLCGVAVCCTFGGLFASSLKAYFSLPAFYYIAALGIGMVIMYLVVVNYCDFNEKNIMFMIKFLIAPAILCVLIYITNYLFVIDTFIEKGEFRFLYYQYKNNFGNYLLIGIPLMMYLAYKKSSLGYYFIALLMSATIIISLSRGATLSIMIVLPILVIALPVFAKGVGRIKFIAALIVLILLLITLSLIFEKEILEMLKKLQVDEDESRVHLYKLAIENFLAHPFFGVGLQYFNPDFPYYHPAKMAIFWYHSTPMQIIGSFGIMGIIFYSAQFFDRVAVLFKNSKMNFFLAMSFIGFEGYQLVNPGDFVPVPFVLLLMVLLTLADRHNHNVRTGEFVDSDDKMILKRDYEFINWYNIADKLKLVKLVNKYSDKQELLIYYDYYRNKYKK